MKRWAMVFTIFWVITYGLNSNASSANTSVVNQPTATPMTQQHNKITIENASKLTQIGNLSFGYPVRSIGWLGDLLVIATAADGSTMGSVQGYAINEPSENLPIFSISGARLLKISPDGSLLAIGNGRTITIQDVASNTPISTLELQTDSMYSFSALSFSPDSKRISTADTNLYIRIWDVETGHEIRSISTYDELDMAAGGAEISTVEFLDNNKVAFSDSVGGSRPVLYLWRFDDATSLTPFETPDEVEISNTITSLSFNQSQNLLASGGWDGKITLWDMDTLQIANIWEAHDGKTTDVVFNGDGTLLASSGIDGTLKLWNANTGELLNNLEIGEVTSSIEFNSEGTLLATGSLQGQLYFWGMPISNN